MSNPDNRVFVLLNELFWKQIADSTLLQKVQPIHNGVFILNGQRKDGVKHMIGANIPKPTLTSEFPLDTNIKITCLTTVRSFIGAMEKAVQDKVCISPPTIHLQKADATEYHFSFETCVF